MLALLFPLIIMRLVFWLFLLVKPRRSVGIVAKFPDKEYTQVYLKLEHMNLAQKMATEFMSVSSELVMILVMAFVRHCPEICLD